MAGKRKDRDRLMIVSKGATRWTMRARRGSQPGILSSTS
jgi:predicted MPP superfamily phosphohydrolase